MQRALRLGVQKTLGVVVLHYRVNLGALSTSYIIPEGLDDDGAEVEMNRVDALAALLLTSSPTTLWRSYFQMLLWSAPSSLESDWAVKPFKFLLELGPHGSCNKYILFGSFVNFNACFISLVAMFHLFPLLGRILAGRVRRRE
jgi:hypothetical protein